MISLIAAVDRQLAIGRDNAMPWHLPDDLKHFKALTLGKPVLMGRRTLEAIGKPLPGRRNLVLSRSTQPLMDGVEAVRSLQEALHLAGDGELMVAGGGDVYAQLLPLAQRLYLTHVDTCVADADTWFPVFDPGQWVCTRSEEHAADARHAFAFRFADYQRAAPGLG